MTLIGELIQIWLTQNVQMARRVLDRAKLQIKHAEGKTPELVGAIVEVQIVSEEGEDKYYPDPDVNLDGQKDQGTHGTFRVDGFNGDGIEWLSMDKED